MRGRRTAFGVVPSRARDALGRARAPGLLGIAALASVAIAGCGQARQDAGEPTGTYRAVARGVFPAAQTIARPTRMVIAVHNLGPDTMPNVALTVDSFTYISKYPELSDPRRPVWVIEQGPGAPVNNPPVPTQEVSQPGNGKTAYVNTWALGPLPSGQTRLFSWVVVPVKPGVHILHYVVSAGLNGKARATTVLGGPVHGHFVVNVAPKPPQTYVDPRTGKVREGAAPIIP